MFKIILILIIIVLTATLFGSNFFGLNKQLENKALERILAQKPKEKQIVKFEPVIPTPEIDPSDVDLEQFRALKDIGINESELINYSDSEIEISFKYPNYLISKKFEDDFAFELKTPHIKPNELPKDYNLKYYSDNTLHILVRAAKKGKDQTLYEYITELYKIGFNERTDQYKKMVSKIHPTEYPLTQSFIYDGNETGWYRKFIWFTYKDNVYTFALTGGIDNGSIYSPESERIFDNIIHSIKFN